MSLWTQRLSRTIQCTAGVLVIGVLLAPQVPIGPLAQQWTSAPHTGCTEQVCYCGEKRCTCAHCDHCGDEQGAHAPRKNADPGENADAGTGGLSFRSCGGSSQGLAGVFAVSKSLVAPAPLLKPAPRLPKHTASPSPDSLASQRRDDDVFRPPKPRIG